MNRPFKDTNDERLRRYVLNIGKDEGCPGDVLREITIHYQSLPGCQHYPNYSPAFLIKLVMEEAALRYSALPIDCLQYSNEMAFHWVKATKWRVDIQTKGNTFIGNLVLQHNEWSFHPKTEGVVIRQRYMELINIKLRELNNGL